MSGPTYQPAGADPEAWSRSSALLEAALAYSAGSHTLADLRDGLVRGEFLLWPGRKSAALTELYRTPRQLVCNVFLAGGDLRELVAMMADAEAWAAERGCNRIEFAGRMKRGRGDGWARIFERRGFRPEVTVYGKELG